MDNETLNLSGNQSPTKNPFCSGHVFDQISSGNISFKDVGRTFSAALIDQDSLTRESLGILPNATLIRDSLTRDFLSNTINNDSHTKTPRESLGILDISAIDLGRDSVAIFNINNPIVKREFTNSQRTVFQNAPQENFNPQILITNSEGDVLNSNKADLLSPKKKITGISSVSSTASTNPSFGFMGFEELSKVSSIGSLQKEIDPSILSMMAITDPLNEAFQLFNGNMYSQSYYGCANVQHSFATDLKEIKNRIRSLPLGLKGQVLGDIRLGNKIENLSFDEGLICRGIEDERKLDNSVFLPDDKLVNQHQTPFNWEDLFVENVEKSFEEERYLLDSTPQPDWNDWDSSKSNIEEDKGKSSVFNKECVSKKVDEMLGMQPVNVEEKLKLKILKKCDSTSPVNTSDNILCKISRASQCSPIENPSCTSNNVTQDLSKISHGREENAFNLIRNLGDIINEKDNLSKTQKSEGNQILRRLADLLSGSDDKSANSEESGNSLAQKLQDTDNKVESPLDLSCKLPGNLSRSKSLSLTNPPPYRTNRAVLANTSTNSKAMNCSGTSMKSGNSVAGSTGSNQSKVSAKNRSASSVVSSVRRHSSVAHSKVTLGTDKLKKSKTGVVVSKREPLRAVVPVENMAKGTKNIGKATHRNATPERVEESNGFALKSKKTTTPLQKHKLKPMAASTPTNQLPKCLKENAVPNTSPAIPRFTRSLSYQPRGSAPLERKVRESMAPKNARCSASKFEGTHMIRRNSVTENMSIETNSKGSPRLQRSFSVGKEPKILSALNKVRKNILNSPYYNPRQRITNLQEKTEDGGNAGEKVGTSSN